MSTDSTAPDREVIKSTRFRSDLAARRSMQWVDQLDVGLLGGRLRRGLDYVDGAQESETPMHWQQLLPDMARKLWLEQRLGTEAFVNSRPPQRFVGGMTGRTGTGWLIRNLGQHVPHEYAVMTEIGLFNFAQFRAAPYEYFFLTGNTPEGRKRYLAYYEDFLLRHAYNSKSVLMGGARGLRDLVPARVIRMGVAELARQLQSANGVDECYQAFGDFYCWLFNFHAVVSSGSPLWISKEPSYGRFAADLLHMIPTAKLVIMVRDGRDVALSMVSRGWHTSVHDALDRWRKFSAATLLGLQEIPDTAYKLVHYEEMVLNYEQTILEIVKFFELPAPQTLIDAGKIGPLTGSVGRWRNGLSRDDLAYYDETCAPLAAELGYA